MRRRPAQLSLFESSPALPSRPYPARFARAIAELLVCSRCGRDIVATRRTASGEVLREFVSEAGECLSCAEKLR